MLSRDPSSYVEGPAEETLRQLKPVVKRFEERVDKLVEHARHMSEHFIGAPEVTDFAGFISALRVLDNGEYRQLVGLLNDCRGSSKHTFAGEIMEVSARGTSQAFREVIEWLKQLYDRQNPDPTDSVDLSETGMFPPQSEQQEKTFGQKFSEDALLLARAVYAYGVNLIDAEWDQGLPISYGAESTIALRISTGSPVSISARDENSSVVRFYRERSNKSLVEKEVELLDGAYVIVGRDLYVTSAFGMRRKDSKSNGPLLSVSPECDLGSRNFWSRAGVMILRKGGQLYLFDRGSKHKINVYKDGNLRVTYVPESVIGSEGERSYGRSEVAQTDFGESESDNPLDRSGSSGSGS